MAKNVTVKKTSQAKKILTNFLEESFKKVATEIEVESKSLCPVKTGALKRSISQKSIDKSTIIIGTFGSTYAIFVEMGTRFQTAQSFMRKAFYNIIGKKL